MKSQKFIIIPLLLTMIITFVATRDSETFTQAEEKVRVEQVVAEEEKTVTSEFSPSGFKSYDVPLSEDLQLYIFELSERYSVPMELIIAVIGQESNYDPSAVRINETEESYGLMQVQPKYHQERMEKFNVHEKDLLNAYANCLIGTDFLAECIEKGGLEWGLMCYNGGAEHANAMTAQGVITEYAESVIYLSENL